jgi:hypothetical protein
VNALPLAERTTLGTRIVEEEARLVSRINFFDWGDSGQPRDTGTCSVSCTGTWSVFSPKSEGVPARGHR